MKIPVRVRSFPGSEAERLDMLAVVRRNCACKGVKVVGGATALSVIEEPCPSHDLLGQEALLKQLVFYRRYHRERRQAQ